MSNEAYYDYYRYVNADLAKRYEAEVGGKRKEILSELLDSTGALAYTASSSWGGPEVVRELVYPFDTPHKEDPHIKTVRTDRFNNERVVILDGKRNRKAGVAFNKPVTDANNLLKDLPDFKAWVISELGINRTGIGGAHESGRGMAMLSTDFGMVDGVYFFRIPSDKTDGKSKEVVIPEGFESLTYGQWYDLVNATESE
ncbi:hypothetical protein VPH234P10_0048 [Vibrio phage 234P10]|nr:Eac protein [Vibrio phage PS17B.1]